MPRSAHYYGLILAGGRGTRFWPRSRRAHSKQVLRFFGDRSLIQQTVDRLSPVIPPDRIWDSDQRSSARRDRSPAARGAEEPDPGRARAAQYRARHRTGRPHSAIHRSQRCHGRLPFRPRNREAGALLAIRSSRVARGRRRKDRRARHSSALARDRLWIHRVSEERSSRIARARGSCDAFGKSQTSRPRAAT